MTAPLWAGNGLAWAAQVALLAGAGLVLPRLLRLRHPGFLLALGQGLLIVILLLPLLQPRRPAAAASATFAATWVDQATEAVAAPLAVSWSGIAWLLAGATAARLGWMALGLAWLARLRRTARPAAAPPGWEALCAEIGVAPPALLVSERVPGPVGFGLRRPVVVLPADFERADSATQRAVLCHEALHARRRDWPATVAEETVRALLWFHPVVGRLVARMRLWREQIVDRAAVALTGDRRGYLDALLHAAAQARLPRTLPAASFLHRNDLGRRVALLVEERPMTQRRLVVSAAIVALGLAAAGALSLAVLPLRADDAAEAVEKGGEVTLPKLIEKIDPKYPAELREEKLDGVVVLLTLVDESGRVAKIEVKESAHDSFTEAAREAVRRWRFEPGRVDGKVAPVELTLTIRFVAE
jgi:TonB family protein